jgi:hypothetical protein
VQGQARDLSEALQGEVIISEFVPQLPYAEAIYPDSTNTIRILTMIDVETQEPIIFAAYHRFGTSRTNRVDNVSAGGALARVDIDTGELGPLIMVPAEDWAPLIRQDRHPDTGAHVAGTHVPYWPEVLAEVRRTASLFPWAYFVGWDVAVTEGGACVIEGNNRPDIFPQHFTPLLLDDRMRAFFEHHGVVRKRRHLARTPRESG